MCKQRHISPVLPLAALRWPGIATLTVLTVLSALALGVAEKPVQAQTERAKNHAASADAKRANKLVEELRRGGGQEHERELFALGATALPALSHGLCEEDAPEIWKRLEVSFTGILGERLQELDTRLDALLATRGDAEQQAQAAADPNADARKIASVLSAEVRAIGYAAALELQRPGATREPVVLLARQHLFELLLSDLRAEVAELNKPGNSQGLEGRLVHLGPLSRPLLALLLESPTPAETAFAVRVRDTAVDRLIALLRKDELKSRTFARESLFGLGILARQRLTELAAGEDAWLRHEALQLLQRIRWQISGDLYERLGHLLEGFEALPWRERRLVTFEIEKQGGQTAIPTLREILWTDPSAGVRVMAAESLSRLGDPVGLAHLSQLGRKLLRQSPEVAAAIAMDQGIRYLQIRRYERAIKEFEKVLEVQPASEIALYNLACAYALKGQADSAFDFLERAVQAGFDDLEHMRKDSDLESLRDDERFLDLADRMRAMQDSEN